MLLTNCTEKVLNLQDVISLPLQEVNVLFVS